MSPSPNKLMIVVAAGPLIGTTTAALFASKGFTHIALLSRNAAQLTQTASFLVPFAKAHGNPNVTLKIYAADVSDTENLLQTLEQIHDDFGPPEVVLYNAAVVRWARIGEATQEELVQEFKVSTVGLYTTALWAYPLFIAAAAASSKLKQGAAKVEYKPTLLITGGGVYKNPQPGSFSLSLNKAAQFNLAMSLEKTYQDRGVRTGVMVANKIVTEEEKFHNPKNIARLIWEMYAKEEGEWEAVFDMGYD